MAQKRADSLAVRAIEVPTWSVRINIQVAKNMSLSNEEVVRDLQEGKTIEKEGVVRMVSFVSFHPRQTTSIVTPNMDMTGSSIW